MKFSEVKALLARNATQPLTSKEVEPLLAWVSMLPITADLHVAHEVDIAGMSDEEILNVDYTGHPATIYHITRRGIPIVMRSDPDEPATMWPMLAVMFVREIVESTQLAIDAGTLTEESLDRMVAIAEGMSSVTEQDIEEVFTGLMQRIEKDRPALDNKKKETDF